MLAYIDPGSGSLLIQALVAAVVSVPFFFRRNISALIHRFRRPKIDDERSGSPDTN